MSPRPRSQEVDEMNEWLVMMDTHTHTNRATVNNARAVAWTRLNGMWPLVQQEECHRSPNVRRLHECMHGSNQNGAGGLRLSHTTLDSQFNLKNRHWRGVGIRERKHSEVLSQIRCFSITAPFTSRAKERG